MNMKNSSINCESYTNIENHRNCNEYSGSIPFNLRMRAVQWTFQINYCSNMLWLFRSVAGQPIATNRKRNASRVAAIAMLFSSFVQLWMQLIRPNSNWHINALWFSISWFVDRCFFSSVFCIYSSDKM